MSKNVISSLALLTSNWYIKKRDYIENFVPFIATLMKKKNYEQVDINEICSDFESEYGLAIPFHPMHTILTRSKKRGIIKKHGGKYTPVIDKISEYEFSSQANEQLRKHEKVINEIIDFADEQYNFKLSREKADSAFISLLKEYDLDILFISEQQQSILPSVKSSKKEKFIINSFIKNAYESEPDIFKFIVDTAIGHLMANSLLCSEYDKYIGKLKGVNIYLDTKIIFRLLGLEGPEREVVYIEFLKTLLKEKAKLYIFKHSYEEAHEILEDSYNWVENLAYDPSVATPITKYFVHNNYTKLDVRRFINKIDAVLEEIGISSDRIVDVPDSQSHIPFQIDEKKLNDLILKIYKKINPFFEESTRKVITLKRDVDSISAIYKLRKGTVPRKLKDVGSVFMTTNSPLALSSRIYKSEQSDSKFCIPACLTDIFIGTILWLQSPSKIFKINEKKLIADCYAALKPDSRLLKKYISEVEKLREERKINDDEYYLLRTDSMVMDLLEEKTLGDFDSFDSKMPLEILNEIRSEIRSEEGKKYLQEKEKHEITLRKYKIVKQDSLEREEALENRAEKISVFISKYLSRIFLLIFILGTIFQILPEIFRENPRFKIGLIILYCLLGIGSFILFLNVIRKKIKHFLKLRIIRFFTNAED